MVIGMLISINATCRWFKALGTHAQAGMGDLATVGQARTFLWLRQCPAYNVGYWQLADISATAVRDRF
jgi:hypothetical protein